MSTILEIKNLSVNYQQDQILNNISFNVESGDFIGLVGPNGSGKTTLIKTILKLLPIKNGEIKLFENNIETFQDFYKIGYLPQKYASSNPLFPATVKEIVLLGLLSQKKIKPIIKKDQKKLIDEILKKLQIKHLENKLLNELSGGQQQKVFLARALVSKPKLLIFDEPSTALDPKSRNMFFDMVQKLNKEDGITIILITHDTGYIGEYANKLLYLDREIIFFGPIENFCEKEKDFESCFEKKNNHIIWHQHK